MLPQYLEDLFAQPGQVPELNHVSESPRQVLQKRIKYLIVTVKTGRQLVQERPQFFTENSGPANEISDSLFTVLEPLDMGNKAAHLHRKNEVAR